MDMEAQARLSGLDVPEEFVYKDATRPTFHRAPGQVGLYITMLDIKPNDPKEYGSMKFMMQDLSDKLLAYLQQRELYRFKVSLEERGLLKGVVLDGYVTGLILAVSCDNLQAVESLESELRQESSSGSTSATNSVKSSETKGGSSKGGGTKGGDMKGGDTKGGGTNGTTSKKRECVRDYIKKYIETSQTLKKLNCCHLEVRIDYFQDELDDCRKDFASQNVISKNLADEDYDRKVLRVVRKFQQNYTKTLYQVRDDQIKYEASIGEFLNLAKTYLPSGIREFTNLDQYDSLVKRARERKCHNKKILEHYIESLQNIKERAQTLLKSVCYPLAQVHAGSESENQRMLKSRIGREIRELLGWLESGDICKVMRELDDDDERPEEERKEWKDQTKWESKVMLVERNMFKDLVCFQPYCIDKLIDTDHAIDQYYDEFRVDIMH